MASTGQIRIEKRLDELEARVKCLESSYVRVPQVPITQEATLTEILTGKPPEKETKNVEQDNGADPGDPTVEDDNQVNS